MLPITGGDTLFFGENSRSVGVWLGMDTNLFSFLNTAMESSLDTPPKPGLRGFVLLYPGTQEDCGVDQMWEPETVDVLPRRAQPQFTLTCLCMFGAFIWS